MGQFAYVTNRTLPNKAGKETGKIKMIVRTGNTQAEGDYTCPECLKQGVINQVFHRPIIVKCAHCGVSMKLPKLKGKIKQKAE